MKNKTQSTPNPRSPDDGLKPSYDFDYAKSKPNRFAGRPKAEAVVVLLDKDVAKVFQDGKAVNHALRSLIGALPAGGIHVEGTKAS